MSLKQLIETRMREIIRKEHGNKKYIHLYGTGKDYWHAFEESAFQLDRIFDNGEFSICRHKDYPFPIVMASVSDNELLDNIRQHIPVCDKPFYKKLLVSELSSAAYYDWHKRIVNEFT